MTGMRKTGPGFLAAAVAAALLLGGCSDDGDATKAGGKGSPVTLRIGTPDFEGTPARDQIEEFARRVKDLSDDELRIETVGHAGGRSPGIDQRVARLVTNGTLDMGLVPTRAWDTEGVTSLRALNAPFLVTSDELLAEVVSGDAAGEMMSGLEKAGVVGLALFPEGLRHPFGYRKPLLGLDDYRGKAIRAPVSSTTSAVFAALGATTNEEEYNADVQTGAESSYAWVPAGTATGNVTFYPKVNSLVMGAEVYEGLDDGQREILEEAAAATREWAIETSPTDAEAAATYCEDGGAVALASESDLAALEEALEPVVAELERDDQTKRIISAIRELKQQITVPGTAPAACGGSGAAPPSTAAHQQRSLDGVYRFELTDQQLRAHGVTDPGLIAENHGVYTWTLSDGGYCWEAKAPNIQANPSECSTYTVKGDRLIINYPTGPPDVYRWEKTADGDLELEVLSGLAKDLPVSRAWAAKPWTRIADAE
jgi:TRAP-type C4-dicarboxylate transport system substrate-binding protein